MELASESAGWYNGFSPAERSAKFRTLKHLVSRGELANATGPCELCGDPDSPVEYHSEDYAAPFRWEAPAMRVLCRHCHRGKLHGRFVRESTWQVFLAHVRRGGYARDLRSASIAAELRSFRLASLNGELATLTPLRPYRRVAGGEWFARLEMRPASLTEASARPARGSAQLDR